MHLQSIRKHTQQASKHRRQGRDHEAIAAHGAGHCHRTGAVLGPRGARQVARGRRPRGGRQARRPGRRRVGGRVAVPTRLGGLGIARALVLAATGTAAGRGLRRGRSARLGLLAALFGGGGRRRRPVGGGGSVGIGGGGVGGGSRVGDVEGVARHDVGRQAGVLEDGGDVEADTGLGGGGDGVEGRGGHGAGIDNDLRVSVAERVLGGRARLCVIHNGGGVVGVDEGEGLDGAVCRGHRRGGRGGRQVRLHPVKERVRCAVGWDVEVDHDDHE